MSSKGTAWTRCSVKPNLIKHIIHFLFEEKRMMRAREENFMLGAARVDLMYAYVGRLAKAHFQI